MKPLQKAAPRWFRIGPGLFLAVVASVIVWRWFPPQRQTPRLERVPLKAPSFGLSAPEPAWLLAQKHTLQLSAAQVQQLTRLRVRWERDTRELHKKLDYASQQFNQNLSNPDGASLPMSQLQERAAPVSELTRRLTAARAAWWQEAGQLLTPTQRRRAEELWAQRFAKPGGTKHVIRSQ